MLQPPRFSRTPLAPACACVSSRQAQYVEPTSTAEPAHSSLSGTSISAVSHANRTGEVRVFGMPSSAPRQVAGTGSLLWILGLPVIHISVLSQRLDHYGMNYGHGKELRRCLYRCAAICGAAAKVSSSSAPRPSRNPYTKGR
jgi:hypothetical protein